MVLEHLRENREQAISGFNDKVRIAERSFKILTEKVGIEPSDIIFDLNIFRCPSGLN